MKKTIIYVFVLFMNFVTLNSYTLGAKGGANFAKLRGENLEELGTRFCLSLGGFVEFPIDNQACLQTEIMYSQKGLHEKTGTGSFEINYSYLEVPVLAKIRQHEEYLGFFFKLVHLLG